MFFYKTILKLLSTSNLLWTTHSHSKTNYTYPYLL